MRRKAFLVDCLLPILPLRQHEMRPHDGNNDNSTQKEREDKEGLIQNHQQVRKEVGIDHIEKNSRPFHEQHGCQNVGRVDLDKVKHYGKRKTTMEGKIEGYPAAIKKVKDRVSHGDCWQNSM